MRRIYFKNTIYNIMKLTKIIEEAIEFGSFRSRNHLFSFALKVLLYILPAVILVIIQTWL
jgi:hypothetical protein